MEQFKRFSQPKDSQEPQKPLPFSEGRYGFGSQFTLTHRVKGTNYSIGDRFTYISQTEAVAHDPYILKIGDGIGEHCFLDPNGRAVVLSSDVGVVNTLFEYVEPSPDVLVLTEGEEFTPPPPAPVYITESQFKEFRKGLATVLSEIAAIVPKIGQQGSRGERGERGEKGEQGESGWTGWPGDKGEQGVQGEKGEKGDKGDAGEQGTQGIQGVQGEKGETGERGERGEKGDRGERGAIGPRGEKGEKGDAGDRGERGIQGAAGKDGKDGKDGAEGKAGRVGEKGLKGDKGDAGERGAQGEKGDKGEQGDSGLVTAKFPLVYDPQEKSVSIDEARLDKILKKILGGGKVSPQDMGWLASTGGGGKVAVYVNGTKITPDVRTLDFSGSGVTATKVGGKVVVNIDYVRSVNGITGPVVGITAGVDVEITQSGNTLTISSPTVYGVSAAIYASNLATGLLHGGTLDINGVCAATFNISAGRGQIHFAGAGYTTDPQPTLTYVDWPAQTGVTLQYLATAPTTWLYFDKYGVLHQQTDYYTDQQIEDTIAIGALVHPNNSTITLARSIPNVAYATDKQYEQFIRAFGPIKVSGHSISSTPGTLQLNRASGTAFILGRNYSYDANNPSVMTDGAKTNCTFYRYYRDPANPTGFATVIDGTSIDPTKWDNQGVLDTVPSGKYTIQRLFFYPKTPDVLGVYYGRALYVSIAEASANINIEEFSEITNTRTNAIFAGYLIVKGNATNLANTADALIIQSGAFRSTTGGGGAVSVRLDDLTDVVLTNIQDDETLIYDAATQEWFNTPVSHIAVTTFNGRTGAVQGVSAAVAGTGISVSGATGTVTITNTGVQSFNGLTGAVQGVSSANGLTGAVTFRAGAGITLSTSGGGISFAIHYGSTAPNSPYPNVSSPVSADRLLIQISNTGDMRMISYGTLLTKASQVSDNLSVSSTYTQSNTNFVVQNTSSGVTEMVSANNVFSSIDGGVYVDSAP